MASSYIGLVSSYIGLASRYIGLASRYIGLIVNRSIFMMMMCNIGLSHGYGHGHGDVSGHNLGHAPFLGLQHLLKGPFDMAA